MREIAIRQQGQTIEFLPIENSTGKTLDPPADQIFNQYMAKLLLDRSKCKGCLQCVKACLTGARAAVGQALSTEEILREAEADRLFFKNSGGGVTISDFAHPRAISWPQNFSTRYRLRSIAA